MRLMMVMMLDIDAYPYSVVYESSLTVLIMVLLLLVMLLLMMFLCLLLVLVPPSLYTSFLL